MKNHASKRVQDGVGCVTCTDPTTSSLKMTPGQNWTQPCLQLVTQCELLDKYFYEQSTISNDTGTDAADKEIDTDIADKETGTEVADKDTRTDTADKDTGTDAADKDTSTDTTDKETGTDTADKDTCSDIADKDTGTDAAHKDTCTDAADKETGTHSNNQKHCVYGNNKHWSTDRTDRQTDRLMNGQACRQAGRQTPPHTTNAVLQQAYARQQHQHCTRAQVHTQHHILPPPPPNTHTYTVSRKTWWGYFLVSSLTPTPHPWYKEKQRQG